MCKNRQEEDVSTRKNYTQKDVSMRKNRQQEDVSLCKNYTQKDVSMRKNRQQEDVSLCKKNKKKIMDKDGVKHRFKDDVQSTDG